MCITARLTHHAKNWEKITKDWSVLETVRGFQIKFTATPQQVRKLHPLYYSVEQIKLVMEEVRDLLLKEVVSQLSEKQSVMGFYSNMFLDPKKDGRWRPIVNVKALDEFVAQSTSRWRESHLERPHKTQRLVNESGPKGRLLHHTNPPLTQEVTQVCLGGECLQIQLSPVRPVISIMGLYQDTKVSSTTLMGDGSLSDNVHR